MSRQRFRTLAILAGFMLMALAIDQGTNIEFGSWYWNVVLGAGFGLAVIGITDVD